MALVLFCLICYIVRKAAGWGSEIRLLCEVGRGERKRERGIRRGAYTARGYC